MMINARLYVNGLYWQTLEITACDTHMEYIAVGDVKQDGFDVRHPSPMAATYRTLFDLHPGGIAGIGDLYFGLCNDPAVYVDPITGRLKCHSKKALLRAAARIG
jgi:hypothetical protein